MRWLDSFLDAFKKAVVNSGESAWFPFSSYRFYPLLADLDIKRWHNVAKTITRKHINAAELLGSFNGPLTIRIEAHLLLLAFKICKLWGTEEVETVGAFLNDLLLKRTANEDPYGQCSAKIHRPDEIKKIAEQTPWQNISNAGCSRNLGNLIMAAIHTAYAYYADYCYCQWFEVLGPYDLTEGRQLLIRRFNNFHPQEVWPEGPFPSFKSMDIFAIYKDAGIVSDQWSHILVKDSLAGKLEKAAVLISGRWAELEHWPNLTNELGKTAGEIQNQWRQFNFEKTKQKLLLARWYQFSNLFNILGLDWRPTKEMTDRIKDRQLLPEITPAEFKTKEEAQKWWKNFADPRTQENLPPSYQRPWEEKYKF